MIFLVKGNPTISRRLRAAVKTAEVRQYRLAEAIGVDHSRLSAWLNGIARVRRGDPRIVKLGSSSACRHERVLLRSRRGLVE